MKSGTQTGTAGGRHQAGIRDYLISLIASLVDMGVLQEITGFQRNRIFILRRYIDIFMD